MNQREKIFISVYDIVINNIFLNDVLSKYVFNNKDDNTAYIKRTISGTLENKLLIDYLINKYSKNDLSKIDKKAYVILLCAIYELLFMDSSKSYAVINEYVKIAKKNKNQFIANFINAILRNISRFENLDKLYNDDEISYRIKYSIPDKLYNYLLNNINSDDINKEYLIKDIFKYYQNNNYISFRVNSIDDKDINEILQELENKNIEYFIYNKSLRLNKIKCILAKNVNDLTNLQCFNKSLISVQDISSIYYIDKLYSLINNKLNKNISVLDSCASPAGKSIALLQSFNSFNIDLILCDKSNNKISKIESNLKSINQYIRYNKLDVFVNDATINNNTFVNQFDLVLLDVPCSGLGIISKKQDIKYNFNLDKINDLIVLQNKILNINKNYVKIDGYLCYSTCTITKNENDNMINKFLLDNSNFELIYKEQILSSYDNMSDGFYFSIMKRLY